MKITEELISTGYGCRRIKAPEGPIIQDYFGSELVYAHYSYDCPEDLMAVFRVKKWKPKGLEWAKLNGIV